MTVIRDRSIYFCSAFRLTAHFSMECKHAINSIVGMSSIMSVYGKVVCYAHKRHCTQGCLLAGSVALVGKAHA